MYKHILIATDGSDLARKAVVEERQRSLLDSARSRAACCRGNSGSCKGQ